MTPVDLTGSAIKVRSYSIPLSQSSLLKPVPIFSIAIFILSDSMLTFCYVLRHCVCTAPECGVALPPYGMVDHLVQKHKVPIGDARNQSAEFENLRPGENISEEGRRYLNNPISVSEEPLPRLNSLPVTHLLIRCTLCGLHCNGTRACKTHLYKKHKDHSMLQQAIGILSSTSFLPGQTVFGGRRKFYFPVRIGTNNGLNETVNGAQEVSARILGSLDTSTGKQIQLRDSIALEDYAMNAWAEELKIGDFLKESNLSCEEAYEMSSRIYPEGSQQVAMKKRLELFILEYFKFFAGKQPRVPSSLIEMVRIRDSETAATFDLFLRSNTKAKYSRSVARVITTLLNVSSSNRAQPLISVPDKLRQNVDLLRNVLLRSQNVVTDAPLSILHRVFYELLLRGVNASQGETVPLENICLVVLSGYASSGNGGRMRVGDAEDASHLAASLQYCCQMSALGEFLVEPHGFGTFIGTETQSDHQRRGYIEQLISTRTVTPASFIRRMLQRTKRLSIAEIPRLSFVPCTEHGEGIYCGFLGAFELRLNGLSESELIRQPATISLSSVVKVLQEKALVLLRAKIMRKYKLPSLFWEKVMGFSDKISCKEPGYWFAEADAELATRSWPESFARHLIQTDDPVLEMRSNGKWAHTPNADKWLKECDEFARTLYVLIHVCSGGPPRGTELLSAKIRNTATGRRNIFLYKKTLAFLISYSKTSRQLGPKPIARFVDSVTCRLLMMYIILVKPVLAKVTQSSLGCDRGERDFLFSRNGKVLEAHLIYHFFKKTMNDHGIPMGLLDYRHYRTGIVKAFFTAGYEAEYGDNGEFAQAGHTEHTAVANYAHLSESFIELNANAAECFLRSSRKWHEKLSLNETWEREVWKRVERGLCGIVEKANMLPGSKTRQLIVCSTRSIDCPGKTNKDDNAESFDWQNGEEEQNDSAPDNVNETIFKVNRNVAGTVLGKERVLPPALPISTQRVSSITSDADLTEERLQLKDISSHISGKIQQHDTRRMTSAALESGCTYDHGESNELQKTEFCANLSSGGFEKHDEIGNEHPAKKCRTMNARDALKLLLSRGGSNPRFRSDGQRYALCDALTHTLIDRHRSCTLVVLPTGGGKTLCWAAAALSEQLEQINVEMCMNVTIVVVPLRSLQNDMIRRAQGYGLNAVSWAERLTACASVVVCVLEEVCSEEYKNFLLGMWRRNRLTRIVLDEAHAVVLWASYRNFSKVPLLLWPHEVEVPLFLLTATAPPAGVADIFSSVGANDKCLKVIRANTERSNISYEVRYVAANTITAMVQNAVQLVCSEFHSMPTRARIIVYCLSRTEACRLTIELAKNLGAPNVHLYHGKLPSKVREKNLMDWIQGDGRNPHILVGTTAIGCGLDHKSVWTVIHVGGSYSLVEFIQESGRLGRDGKSSKSIILFNEEYYFKILGEHRNVVKEYGRIMQKSSVSSCTRRSFQKEGFLDWVRFKACRRQIIAEIMDGRRRNRCDAQREEVCDNCVGWQNEKEINNSVQRAHVPKITPTTSAHSDTTAKMNHMYPHSTLAVQYGSPTMGLSDTAMDREQMFWQLSQLAARKCAICIFSGRSAMLQPSHALCVQGRCYRCMKRSVTHQSKSCEAGTAFNQRWTDKMLLLRYSKRSGFTPKSIIRRFELPMGSCQESLYDFLA